MYLLTALLVAYRFLGYVLVLLRRCTRIYVQQYCTVNSLRSNKFHQFIISLLQVITGYTYVYTSSQLAWWRTVSLGTYWYCCSGVLVLTCVPPSCQVVSTGEIGTQPLYLAASDTGYTYEYTSSQLAWWRTVSLGTYWYCCGGVLVYTYSSTVLVLTRFARINFINSLCRCCK